jgi:hypothetical protein
VTTAAQANHAALYQRSVSDTENQLAKVRRNRWLLLWAIGFVAGALIGWLIGGAS